MLKILIVDDDVFVHTNLKKMINWEGEGFLLCNAAANGMEAIRQIEAESPEIVITDMNMPGVNGVALIKYIHEHFPAIRVIALSAYDDFEYVKQSLKMGAVDYILKHTLNPQDLQGLLLSVKETILLEKQKVANHRKIEEQLQTGKSVLRQNFIKRLVREGIKDRAEICQKIAALDLELGSRNFVVVAGEVDDYSLLREKFSVGEINNVIQSVLDIVTEILRDTGNSLVTMLEEGKLVIVFSFDDTRSNQNVFNQVFAPLARIKTTIKRYLNITACFGFAEIFQDITEIKTYYDKAERLLGKKFYEGKDHIFHDPAVGEVRHNLQILAIKDEKNIMELIKSRELEKLQSYLGDVFVKIQHYQPDANSTKMTFVTLINIINKIIRDSGLDPTLIFGDNQDPYETLEKFDTVQEVKDWFLANYAKLTHGLERFCLNPEYDEVTKKAVEYIYKNYQKNVSLIDIAEHTSVNSSYLSRKFKKDCGKGVSEFLNSLRIEQAKMLMEDGHLRVKEIADKVGFNNYNYFFKVFKDSEGMTPLEYEKSFRVKVEDL